MNDRQIESLVRMAAEIEELERAAGASPAFGTVHSARVRGAHRGHRRSVLVRLSPFLAAAACLGLAVMLARREGMPTPPSPVPVAIDTPTLAPGHPSSVPAEAPVNLAAAISPEQFRDWMRRLDGSRDVVIGLLSIVQDQAGHVVCMHFEEHDFGGRKFEDLTAEDLVRASYAHRCDVVGPYRVISLALRGTRENLPVSAERAHEVAQCFLSDRSIATCAIEPPTFADAARTCVPHGLRAKAALLAMR